MNNLPKNNDDNFEEEFSTIFSDPQEHKRVKASGGKKKVLKSILSVVLVGAIIGGTIAIVKLIPLLTKEVVVPNTKIVLCDYGAGYNSESPSDTVSTVEIKNKNGSFTLYSETVESSYDEIGYELFWYLKGVDKDLISTDSIKDKVSAAVDINAIRLIDTKNEKECGLTDPVVSAKVSLADKTSFTVDVGNKSPDNAGVYVKISTKEGIYLVNSNLDEELTFTALEFAIDSHPGVTLDTKYSDYMTSNGIQSFDSLTVSGKNFPKDVVFELNPNTELAGYTPYVMTAPMKRGAENVDAFYTMFSQGFMVDGAYSYDVKEETLKKFGLDSPDYVVSMRFDDFVYSYKFALQKDGYYAFVGNDSKNVKKASAETLPFLDYTTEDFYSKVVFITPISGVKNVTLKTADKTYSFDITKNPKGSEEVNTYIVECDGKVYNSTYFQSFYQFLCLIECMEFDVVKTEEKPELTITYKYNDSSKKPTVIEFVKVDATKYQCTVDGVKLGKVGSSTYEKIHKNLQRLLEGKQIIVN